MSGALTRHKLDGEEEQQGGAKPRHAGRHCGLPSTSGVRLQEPWRTAGLEVAESTLRTKTSSRGALSKNRGMLGNQVCFESGLQKTLRPPEAQKLITVLTLSTAANYACGL